MLERGRRLLDHPPLHLALARRDGPVAHEGRQLRERQRPGLPSASIAATKARTSAGEASRFVIFKPVRNISSTSWTDNSPERSRSYLRKNARPAASRTSLLRFLSLSWVFMSRGFLTVRLKRCVARLALVARRMVVLCCVVSACVSRLGGARRRRWDSPVGGGAALRRAGQPQGGPKSRWAALGQLAKERLSPDARWGSSRGRARGSVGASRPPRAERDREALLEAKMFGLLQFFFRGAAFVAATSTCPRRVLSARTEARADVIGSCHPVCQSKQQIALKKICVALGVALSLPAPSEPKSGGGGARAAADLKRIA